MASLAGAQRMDSASPAACLTCALACSSAMLTPCSAHHLLLDVRQRRLAHQLLALLLRRLLHLVRLLLLLGDLAVGLGRISSAGGVMSPMRVSMACTS